MSQRAFQTFARFSGYPLAGSQRSNARPEVVATETSDTASIEGTVASSGTPPKQQTDVVLNDIEKNIREYLKQTGQDNMTKDQQKDLFI
jgi:hypothetical protein